MKQKYLLITFITMFLVCGCSKKEVEEFETPEEITTVYSEVEEIITEEESSTDVLESYEFETAKKDVLSELEQFMWSYSKYGALAAIDKNGSIVEYVWTDGNSGIPRIQVSEDNVITYVLENNDNPKFADAEWVGAKFSEGMTYVPDNCFRDCQTLDYVYLHDNIETIGTNSFYLSGIKSLDLPRRLKSIGDYSFYGCKFTSIKTPESCESIGFGAFQCCLDLNTVSISEGCKKIDALAFWNCSSLESVTIPSSIEFIGEAAFTMCNLKEVRVPSNCLIAVDSFDADVKVIRYDSTNSSNVVTPTNSEENNEEIIEDN